MQVNMQTFPLRTAGQKFCPEDLSRIEHNKQPDNGTRWDRGIFLKLTRTFPAHQAVSHSIICGKSIEELM